MTTTPTPKDRGRDRPSCPGSGPRGHIGWIVAGSLATGLVAALLFAAAPFIPAEERAVTGAVLCGFALGWAMLAVLSVRFTDQPQRWAVAPALVMGVGGLLLVGLAPQWTGCSTGSGPRPCWGWPSGCSSVSIDSFTADSDAGCCIR